MGRVAWLIFVVVVSVCVVFCVLCCLQNNPVFSSVTIFHILKMKIMSYVFWQISLSIKLRPEKNTTGKKKFCISFFCQCSRMSPYFICYLSRYSWVVVLFFCCGSRQIWAVSKTICRKIMWNSSRQISAASKTIRRKIMWKIWRKLVLHYFPADCFGIDFFSTKSEPVQLCGCVGFFVVVPAKSELPPKQSAEK